MSKYSIAGALRAATLAAAASALLVIPATAEQAPDADSVLARVGDAEITLGHAIALRDQLPEQFRQVPDETLFPAIVEQLIDQEMLQQAGAATLGRRDRLALENEVRNFIANAALAAEGEAALSDEAITAAYDAFVAAFQEGEAETEYNAAHILVQTEEEITEVVARLEAGEDFAEVAQDVSLDGSSARGGDLGWFGEGVMIEPFEAAVMALEPGQVSPPVETRFGWHVVRLLDTRVAQAPPLEEVREALENQIRQEASRAAIERLREGSSIEDLSDGFDPALLSRGDLLDD